ncbi:hypothetical protein NDI39_29340 [Microcoleus sp. ZQ-A2]|nr:hypothetical protein [Microcoleus sp. FACHB-1]
MILTLDEDFEIIALNGLTGECLTTDDAKLDAIRQEHEAFFTQLEALAVNAIASGDWDELYDFLNEVRGVTNPQGLHRVSLQDFLTLHPCTLTPKTITDSEAGARLRATERDVDELDNPNAPDQSTTRNES